MGERNANVYRFIKYVGPVFTFAILFNIPAFLEARVVFVNSTGKYEPAIDTTDLYSKPDYIIQRNLTRLVIHEFIPIVLLLFFNSKIYHAIRVSIELFQNVRYWCDHSC